MQSAPTAHTHTPHLYKQVPFEVAEPHVTGEKPKQAAPEALSMDARSISAFDVYSGVLLGGGF